MIEMPDTVINPRAMMIHLHNTSNTQTHTQTLTQYTLILTTVTIKRR